MTLRGSQKLALIALFAAIAVVLNGVTVPAPYEPFLLYGVWEIPVLTAMLMLGFLGGVSVASLNAIGLEALNPGALPTGPIYNLVAQVSMFLGVLAAVRLAKRARWGTPVLVVLATAAGAVLRTGVMTAVNWAALPQPYPVGFSVDPSLVPGLLVFIGIFNFTVVLYTVPVAFSVLRAVESRYPSVRPG
ncbi:MAG: hypothetical protein HY247_08040 [archaeon]|nr:MAG: hypothetical protein HY247_08040 [archaeon]